MAAAIVVISEQTRRELLSIVAVPESKVMVLPNFVDPTFTFSERPFSAKLPRILHVGTTPNKNLGRVVAALHGLPCVLVIVGEVPADIRRELEANAIRHENFVGLDHAAMLGLYRDADIISFPSTYEGFGMPILEGQAIGRPVLTSDREPMRSVSGQGGALLIDPESVAAIRQGFVELLSDGGLRARLVAAGHDNSRRYSLDSVADGYLKLYRRLESV
jgi:glycosyltransferase involved in cell wall biosynthesis